MAPASIVHDGGDPGFCHFLCLGFFRKSLLRLTAFRVWLSCKTADPCVSLLPRRQAGASVGGAVGAAGAGGPQQPGILPR